MVRFSTDEGLFGSLTPRHFAGATLGFANAWAPLVSFEGGARFWHAKSTELCYNLFVVALSGSVGMGLILRLLRRRTSILRSQSAGDAVGSLVWLVAVFGLAAVWSPTYEKLWLFGSAATLCLVSTLFDRTPGPTLRREWWPVGSLAALVVCSFVVGLLPRRFEVNRDILAAELLTKRLSASDLIVCPGWDLTSVYFRR